MTVMEASEIQIEAIRTLSADLKAAARTLSRVEARYLVDAYYILQRDRIRARHQERTLAAGEEPHSLITWLGDNAAILERNLKTVLGVYAATHVVGRWAQAQVGIGPVISAGLIAHIDIARAPTVGHIWRFAGLDPTVARATKGERRPWNGALKRLCWLIGESFKKTSNHEDGFYGALYRQRKA